jgi:hypothetical protein
MCDRYTVTSIFLLFVISACARDNSTPMQRFADGKDRVVREHRSNINSYLKSPYLYPPVTSTPSIQESQSEIMEYSFTQNGMDSHPERRCKFIFVVQKATGTIIGWRYNDKPEYCLQAM